MAYRLQIPPSANAIVRPARIGPDRCEACNSMRIKRSALRLVATREAEAFREAAHRKLPKALLSGPVEVLATYYLDRLSADGPNRGKALYDALQGFLYTNDCQVAELHEVYLFVDDKHPEGVVFDVVAADPVVHAERARRLAKSVIGQRENERHQAKLFDEKPTDGGSFDGRGSSPGKPSDARGGGDVGPPRPRAVQTLPEQLQQRLTRLVRPAVVSHRPQPDDEPPEAA